MKAVQLAAAAALALLAFAPGVAAAQDGRTVEGAQEFLALQARSIDYIRWGTDDPLSREFLDRSFRIQPGQAKAVGRCSTEFTHIFSSEETVRVDWASVSEVRNAAGGIFIWGGVDQIDANAELFIQGDQMQDRLAAAMQFLQAQCDRSRSTGF